MNNNEQYRNMTLSLKVTPSQKAEYVKIASSLNITLSEWLNSIIEMNKNSYEKVGDPTNIEIKLGLEIEQLNREIQELKNKLTIAEEQKGIELKSNFELRQLVAEWKVYGNKMKNKLDALNEAYLNLDDKYRIVCENIDAFAEKQDGYVFFNWLNIDEIRGLKE